MANSFFNRNSLSSFFTTKESKNKEFLETVKVDLFGDKIYCYTPKGDIKELPRESTVLDFAYIIHRDIGNSCIGGEINGKFKSSDFELQDDDRVKIKTSPHKKKPSQHWLNVVKTSRARSEIRKALRG